MHRADVGVATCEQRVLLVGVLVHEGAVASDGVEHAGLHARHLHDDVLDRAELFQAGVEREHNVVVHVWGRPRRSRGGDDRGDTVCLRGQGRRRGVVLTGAIWRRMDRRAQRRRCVVVVLGGGGCRRRPRLLLEPPCVLPGVQLNVVLSFLNLGREVREHLVRALLRVLPVAVHIPQQVGADPGLVVLEPNDGLDLLDKPRNGVVLLLGLWSQRCRDGLGLEGHRERVDVQRGLVLVGSDGRVHARPHDGDGRHAHTRCVAPDVLHVLDRVVGVDVLGVGHNAGRPPVRLRAELDGGRGSCLLPVDRHAVYDVVKTGAHEGAHAGLVNEAEGVPRDLRRGHPQLSQPRAHILNGATRARALHGPRRVLQRQHLRHRAL
eukprot:PhM_4_TR9527/c0_g1_i1/m.70787